MIRYFVNYEDYLKCKHDIPNETDIYIARKNSDGNYNIVLISLFKDIENIDRIKQAIAKDSSIKSLLMVEIKLEERDEFSSFKIKEFERVGNGKYRPILDDLKLLNCRFFAYSTEQDAGKGYVIEVLPHEDNDEYLKVEDDISSANGLTNRRKELQKQKIGSDIYFYPMDSYLLDKYEEDVVTLRKVDEDKYIMISHKLFVIDSVSYNTIKDMNFRTRALLDQLLRDSTKIAIREENDKYSLDSKSIDQHEKKGYIINNIKLLSIFYNYNVEPLLKYINVFELVDGYYKKIPMVDYLKRKDILKYIKKPS